MLKSNQDKFARATMIRNPSQATCIRCRRFPVDTLVPLCQRPASRRDDRHRIQCLVSAKDGIAGTRFQELQDVAQRIARKHGLTISEVLGRKRKSRKTPVPAKYRNPNAPGQTLVRPRAPASLVQGSNGRRQARREPRNLISGYGRQCFPPISLRNRSPGLQAAQFLAFATAGTPISPSRFPPGSGRMKGLVTNSRSSCGMPCPLSSTTNQLRSLASCETASHLTPSPPAR